ncbi:hypothetical protein RRG08_019642 [Elysia crispata]|uniref:SCP domain-containing protein n=1 Tax=Elysia crispata TaxID=231223 RepID=A0AAE1DL49_9GAST|nr:hypothetical protein RRG08_019642 [Elysia crispata]
MTPHLLQCLTFMSAVYLVSSQSEPAPQLSESQKALLYGRPRNFVRTANASKTSFTEEEKSVLLQLHNAYRSMAQPPAQNMRELVWDTDLEEYARQHSQACSGGHSARSMVKVWSPLVSERWDLMGENLYWSYGKYQRRLEHITLDLRDLMGENLYWSYGDRYSIEEAMWMFWEEGSGYDIYNNTCNHRLTCGHYKALVLESSWRVGCSINQCDRFTDNPYPGPAMFMTCNYNGMYIDTDRPYTVGDSCSGCTRRSVGSQFANCRHRLCVSSRQLRGGTGFDGNTALIGIQHSDFTSGDDRTDLHTRELTTPPIMQITTTTTPINKDNHASANNFNVEDNDNNMDNENHTDADNNNANAHHYT